MIHYKHGDIITSPCKHLVNPVNCEGYMGKGLAKQFATTFPEILSKYKEYCAVGKMKPGVLLYTPTDRTPPPIILPKIIVNFPTKVNWRNPSQYDWIKLGLQTLVRNAHRREITCIAFPPLGCGNGKLEWNSVALLMEQYLLPLSESIYIEVYGQSIDQ